LKGRPQMTTNDAPPARSGDAYFRANVGALIVEKSKKVLALRRRGVPEETWQLPQGGIGFDEVPAHAVWREVREETGLLEDDIELLDTFDEWLIYELPKEFRNSKVGWGQAQRWFLFAAKPGAIVKPDGNEFDAYRWFTTADLLDQVVEFRKPVYRRVFLNFARWLET